MKHSLPNPLLSSQEIKREEKIDFSNLELLDLILIHKNQNLLNKPSAVIFDMSSTIISSHNLDIEAIDTVLQSYGKLKWKEGTRKLKEPEKSMKDNFPNFFGVENAKKAYQEYIDYLLKRKERMPLIDGTVELLTFLKSNEIRVYIVSNRDRMFIDEMIEYHNIENLIDDSICAGDTPYTKPDPRIATTLLSKHKIDPQKEEVLFVGDALADIRCAEESFCVPVLLTEVITDMNPDFIRSRMENCTKKSMRIISSHFGLFKLIENSFKKQPKPIFAKYAIL